MQVKTGIVALGLALISGISYGQKMAETDAALQYRDFKTAMSSGDMASAKKNILKAKGSIDKAASNPETEKSAKTLYYKGEIYSSLVLMSGLAADDATFTAQIPADADVQGINAYKASLAVSGKFKGEIEGSIHQMQQLLRNAGSMAYEKKMFKEGMEAFSMVNKYTSVIGETDTLSIYYAGICAENDTNWVEAAKYYRQCADMNYKPESIYRTTAVAYIRSGQKEEALNFLKQAILKSPKDKHLYFALGTIAMDMEDDELVQTNLTKATEIDPNFADAYYNLGSYFSSKGVDLRKKADNLPPSAKKESEEMLNKSLDFFKLALVPLEKYVALQPKDADVLLSLVKMARALNDKEKEAKYKAMLDEAKK